MNIDMLIDGILDSYDRYGGINRSGSENFPNRQNVIFVLQDLHSLVFPGFTTDEDINSSNIRFITGAKVNNIISILTKEIQKALVYELTSKNVSTEKLTDLLVKTTILLRQWTGGMQLECLRSMFSGLESF